MRRNWLQCVSARGVLVDEAGVCAQAAAMWGVWHAFLSAPLAPALKEERQLQLGEPEPSAAQHAALGFGRSVLQTDAETGDYSGLASTLGRDPSLAAWQPTENARGGEVQVAAISAEAVLYDKTQENKLRELDRKIAGARECAAAVNEEKRGLLASFVAKQRDELAGDPELLAVIEAGVAKENELLARREAADGSDMASVPFPFELSDTQQALRAEAVKAETEEKLEDRSKWLGANWKGAMLDPDVVWMCTSPMSPLTEAELEYCANVFHRTDSSLAPLDFALPEGQLAAWKQLEAEYIVHDDVCCAEQQEIWRARAESRKRDTKGRREQLAGRFKCAPPGEAFRTECVMPPTSEQCQVCRRPIISSAPASVCVLRRVNS